MRKLKALGITSFFMLINTAIALGQSAPTLPGAPSQAPIDGGLSILAAAGVGYAMHKLKNKHQE